MDASPSPGRPDAERVGRAALREPRRHPVTLTAGEARGVLATAHVHQLLLVDGQRLVGTVEVDDLVGLPDAAPVLDVSVLQGRTVGPGAPLGDTHAAMLATGRRRLAVVDDAGTLLGLLCLKASGAGFCTDDGVAARRTRAG